MTGTAKQEFHKLDIEIESAVNFGSISLDGKPLQGVTKIKFDWSPENLVKVEIEMIVQKGKIALDQLRMHSSRTLLDVEKKEPAKPKRWSAVVDKDTCPHCNCLDGKKVFPNQTIQPPLKQCTSPNGCRCVLEEIE